jgi:hypothetical protein
MIPKVKQQLFAVTYSTSKRANNKEGSSTEEVNKIEFGKVKLKETAMVSNFL